LTECFKDIKCWMMRNFLLLNSDKTEVLLIGPKNYIQNLSQYNFKGDFLNVLDLQPQIPYFQIVLPRTKLSYPNKPYINGNLI